MNATEAIEEYIRINKLTRITPNDIPDLQMWLQRTYRKRMPRPLFVTRGSGGGQLYRMWWMIFDVLGNRNQPCYFYVVPNMQRCATYLKKHGHLSLQHWIDDTSPQLQGTP